MTSTLTSRTAISAVLLSILLAAPVVYLVTVGYSKQPAKWWYPFIPSLFTDHYTTGPFAMTSNTREDNPVWPQIPTLNLYQARLSYAMTRGEPVTEVAWLYPFAEWPDKPTLPFTRLDPNRSESPLSRALVSAGLNYDRISRASLQGAGAERGRLLVGRASYQALLISDLTVAEPDLLARVLTLAEQGVQVFWHGDVPVRAPGWNNHAERDEQVRLTWQALQTRVQRVEHPRDLDASFTAAGLQGVLAGEGARVLRTQRRAYANGQLILLFNPTSEPVSGTLRTHLGYLRAEILNPEDGSVKEIDNPARLALSVPARRVRLVHLFSPRKAGDEDASAASWHEPDWRQPPRSLYPYIRWWWPGNAVEQQELGRELISLYEAGFGGVELQTLSIGFTHAALDDGRDTIYQVGSRAHLANVRQVMEQAGELGMAVDLTLGSGWSGGGPFIKEYPEQQLLRASLDIEGPASIDSPLPQARMPDYVEQTNWVIDNTISGFDSDTRLVAVVAGRIDRGMKPPRLSGLVDISAHVIDGRVRWEAPAGDIRLFAFYQNATRHNVAASAYVDGRDHAPVHDHLHPGGAREYIRELGENWLASLHPHQPAAWFVDSFELIGELPWTTGFRRDFESLNGYDLTPYLPLVFKAGGESKYVNVVTPPEPAYQAPEQAGTRIREDYEATREHLFMENYLKPLKAWAASRGIALRVQAHGGYGDYLDAYQMADIPESEGLFGAGAYDFLKLASSAGHVSGARIISSESFIRMTMDFNGLEIEDYYFLAGNAYAAGINRTVCHGYAYHYRLDRH